MVALEKWWYFFLEYFFERHKKIENVRAPRGVKNTKNRRDTCLQVNPVFSLEMGCLRWFDTVFQGQYLPSLRINYVAINKDLEKLPHCIR